MLPFVGFDKHRDQGPTEILKKKKKKKTVTGVQTLAVLRGEHLWRLLTDSEEEVGWLVSWLLNAPVNMPVYLRDGSAQTNLRAATLR